LKKLRDGADMKNQNGNDDLKGNATQHESPINPAAIIRKKHRQTQDERDTN
jgi:hypothetical protein